MQCNCVVKEREINTSMSGFLWFYEETILRFAFEVAMAFY